MALEQTDGSVFRFERSCCRPGIPRPLATPPPRALREVHPLVRGAGACTSTRPLMRSQRLSAHFATPRRPVRFEFRGRARLRAPVHHCWHEELPPERSVPSRSAAISTATASASISAAAIARWPRWSTAGRLQRRDGLGPVPKPSAVSLRRHHGLAAQGRRASAARRRHRRQRRRRLRQQRGPRRLALPRRGAGPLRRAHPEHLLRSARGMERRAVRSRERRRRHRARRLDALGENACSASRSAPARRPAT